MHNGKGIRQIVFLVALLIVLRKTDGAQSLCPSAGRRFARVIKLYNATPRDLRLVTFFQNSNCVLNTDIHSFQGCYEHCKTVSTCAGFAHARDACWQCVEGSPAAVPSFAQQKRYVIAHDYLETLPLPGPLICMNTVPVAHLTASSFHREDIETRYSPAQSCLHNTQNSEGIGAWVAAFSDTDKWIQADFRSQKVVWRVTTQGRPGVDQWVTQYKIRYSSDFLTWHTAADDNGSAMIFPGNNNRDSAVVNDMPEGLVARYLRLYPEAAYTDWAALRWEALGLTKHVWMCLRNTTLQHYM